MRNIRPVIVKITLLSVIMIIAGRLSLFLTGTSEGVALIWLPAGVALVALVFIGRHLWPAVAIGSSITNVTFGLPISAALGIAGGSTLGAVAGVYALQLAAFSKRPERVINAVKFNGIGATVSSSVSAIAGVTALHVAGIIPEESLLDNGLRWWTGDALGIVLVGGLMWVYFGTRPPAETPDEPLVGSSAVSRSDRV
jgi:integral membrane sensor domain MASE1